MVWGTRTSGNDPPSEDVTLDTQVDFPYLLDEPKRIRELVSTVQGEYCYGYMSVEEVGMERLR